MLLYEAPGSPYAQKIKIALREKSVPFDIEWPDSLGTGRTDGPFGLANPRNRCRCWSTVKLASSTLRSSWHTSKS